MEEGGRSRRGSKEGEWGNEGRWEMSSSESDFAVELSQFEGEDMGDPRGY